MREKLDRYPEQKVGQVRGEIKFDVTSRLHQNRKYLTKNYVIMFKYMLIKWTFCKKVHTNWPVFTEPQLAYQTLKRIAVPISRNIRNPLVFLWYFAKSCILWERYTKVASFRKPSQFNEHRVEEEFCVGALHIFNIFVPKIYIRDVFETFIRNIFAISSS